jgi:RsiW-degrading membrane proteinase PrsW (M82 family)
VLITTIAMYFMLGACGLAIGLVARRYDLYNREPWYMVLLAVALGAGAMWLAYYIEVGVIHAAAANGVLIGPVTLASLAGVTEELAKFGVVAVIAMVVKRQFSEPIDGLVYGSFAGLGAALEESVGVLQRLTSTMYLPPQEPVRLVGHLVMGGIGGFGLGLIMMRSWRAWTAVGAGLLGAILLHIGWDVAAFADGKTAAPRLLTWHALVPMSLMLSGMLVYRRLVGVGARLTRAYLNVCDVRTRRCPPY